MRASGRLARVRSSWMGLYFEEPCPKDGTLPQFNMSNVILPFAILGGGVVCAIGVLCIEYAIKKWFGRLLVKEDSALESLARKHGARLNKGWQAVQDKMPDIAADAPQGNKTTWKPSFRKILIESLFILFQMSQNLLKLLGLGEATKFTSSIYGKIECVWDAL